jgi:hypothetical protein
MQLTDTHQTKIYRGEGHQNSQVGQLIAEKVELIDTAGNTYLNSPAAYILMCGNGLPRAKTTAKLVFIPVIPNYFPSRKWDTPKNLAII